MIADENFKNFSYDDIITTKQELEEIKNKSQKNKTLKETEEVKIEKSSSSKKNVKKNKEVNDIQEKKVEEFEIEAE